MADLAIAIEVPESRIAVGATPFGLFQIREPGSSPRRQVPHCVVHGYRLPRPAGRYGHGFGAMCAFLRRLVLSGRRSRGGRTARRRGLRPGGSEAHRYRCRTWLNARSTMCLSNPGAVQSGRQCRREPLLYNMISPTRPPRPRTKSTPISAGRPGLIPNRGLRLARPPEAISGVYRSMPDLALIDARCATQGMRVNVLVHPLRSRS